MTANTDLGDVKINEKWYRIDLESYRSRDIVDFSPRAATPGGGIILSDLMLYQPLMQSDWRHGIGFQNFDDPAGYLTSVGNIDTRHEGIVTMYTNKVDSDTAAYRKVGAVMHQKKPYFWGPDGLRWPLVAQNPDGGKTITWSSTPTPGAATEHMLFAMSLGDALIVSPKNDRIRTTKYTGEVTIQPEERDSEDSWLSEHDPTVNKYLSETLKFGHLDGGDCHLFLKFPFTEIPTGATIDEAKLTFMVMGQETSESGSIPKLHLSRIKRTVVEKEVTWNKASASVNWTTAGGTNTTDDIESTSLLLHSAYPDDHAEMNSETRQFFTLTLDPDEVGSMITSNKGFLVFVDGESVVGDNYVEFASAKEVNEDWRPYLKIKYTKSGEWTDTGEDEDAKNYHWGVTHNGFSYLGVRNTNRVHYSSSATLSDLEGTDADPSHIKIGVSTYPTITGVSFLGNLYVAKPDGLWQVGDDKIARRVLDFSAETSNDNFKTMAVFNGYLIFTIRDSIFQWNGARLNRITPPRISDDWPYLQYGKFDNFVSVGDFMYCTARTNENIYTESILCYDGVGWHKLMDTITDGVGATSLLFYDPVNNFLWIHYSYTNIENLEVTNTNVTSYVQFQGRSPYPYSFFPTSGTHSLYTCKHDMGFARVTKSSPSILVEADNLSSTRYLDVYYSTDGEDWVRWGRITEDGVTELKNPGGLLTIEYKTIQLRVDFVTATTGQTPILKGLTLRFLMRPEVAYGWNFNIVAADHFVYGEREDTRTADIIIQDIKTARDSKAPVEFVDIQGREHYAYISSYSEIVQERHIGEQQDGVPYLESAVNVNIVEAK